MERLAGGWNPELPMALALASPGGSNSRPRAGAFTFDLDTCSEGRYRPAHVSRLHRSPGLVVNGRSFGPKTWAIKVPLALPVSSVI